MTAERDQMGKGKPENAWKGIRAGAGSRGQWGGHAKQDGKPGERKIESVWKRRLNIGKLWVGRWEITEEGGKDQG